jgi:hypothetical protein
MLMHFAFKPKRKVLAGELGVDEGESACGDQQLELQVEKFAMVNSCEPDKQSRPLQ